MTERIIIAGTGDGKGIGNSQPRRELDDIDREAEREGRAVSKLNSLARRSGRREIHHTKDSR